MRAHNHNNVSVCSEFFFHGIIEPNRNFFGIVLRRKDKLLTSKQTCWKNQHFGEYVMFMSVISVIHVIRVSHKWTSLLSKGC